MRKTFLLLAGVFVVACQDNPVATHDRPAAPTEPRMYDAGGPPPSSTEYYPDEYPPVPDEQDEYDDSEPLSAAGYTCPLSLVGATVPGNIWPFHKTVVGIFRYPLTRTRRTGYSPGGIPKAEYKINIAGAPWISDDGQIAILSGFVEGWCRFTPTGVFRTAVGSLHVFRFEGPIIESSSASPPPPNDCKFADDPNYDPYEDQTNECGAGGGGGGGGGGTGGAGTQYYPGDHTGGQTVNWQTGIGNGGASVCGQAAVVAEICIDYYNESTGQWEQWSCGYATTC
jgi:hypothetical protein